MRRFVAAIAAVLMLGLVPISALAAPEPVSEWNYTVADDGVEITGYAGGSADVVIPSELEGRPVTKIGQGAFRNGTMRSIVVPDSVNYISNSSFENCKNLEEVRLPYRAEHMGTYAFDGCSKLRSLVLPKGLEPVTGLCRDCEELREVVIPYGTEYIGGYAFTRCHQLGPITVPETVSEVGSGAFGGCTRMSVLTFGGSPEEWRHVASSSDLPLTTRIWGTEGLSFTTSVSGPTGQLVPGQDIELQVAVEGDIPEWAVLGVELDLEGISAPTYQVNLTAENKTGVLTGTVMSGAQTAKATLVAVGGRAAGEDGINEASWSAPVSGRETTYYETVEIGVGDTFTSVQDVIENYELPEGATIGIFNSDGTVRDESLPLGTGNLIRVKYADGSEQVLGTVIKGDVAGTGLLSLEQLTRLAAALSDQTLLSELEALAGDLNGDGRVSLIDLVEMAEMWRNATLTR